MNHRREQHEVRPCRRDFAAHIVEVGVEADRASDAPEIAFDHRRVASVRVTPIFVLGDDDMLLVVDSRSVPRAVEKRHRIDTRLAGQCARLPHVCRYTTQKMRVRP